MENWLKHNIDSRLEPKFSALMSKFGPEGYGVYWIIIEEMYRSDDMRLKIDGCPHNLLSCAWNIDPKKLDEIIGFCVMIGLFGQREDYIFNVDVAVQKCKRIKKLDDILDLKREAGRKGGLARVSKLKESQAESSREKQAQAEPSQRERRDRGELDKSESKIISGEEPPPPEIKNFAPKISMTDKEYQTLIEEFGVESVNYHLKTCSDWLLSSGKIKKSSVAFMRNWIRKDIAECKGFYYPKKGFSNGVNNFDKNIQERERLLKLEAEGRL